MKSTISSECFILLSVYPSILGWALLNQHPNGNGKEQYKQRIKPESAWFIYNELPTTASSNTGDILHLDTIDTLWISSQDMLTFYLKCIYLSKGLNETLVHPSENSLLNARKNCHV